MQIDPEMIRPELRRIGKVGYAVNLLASPVRLQRMGRMMAKAKMPIHSRRVIKQDVWIERPDHSKLRLAIFWAKQVVTKRPATGILWLHGGGYALESAENTLVYAEQLVADGRSVMVAPDYTTSALAPYPAALDDCYLALTWLRDSATRFGVNPNQLVVGGDSAVGGLTVAVCLRARDQGDVWQIPIYPMLDDRLVLASAKKNDAPVWNSRVNQAAWDLYLGDLPLDKIPIYAAPGRATDLAGLPPAITYVGDLDPFLDETCLYAKHLERAGIPVACKVFNGCYHGFDQVAPHADVTKVAHDFLRTEFFKAQAKYWAAN